jgi:hypothetical protein
MCCPTGYRTDSRLDRFATDIEPQQSQDEGSTAAEHDGGLPSCPIIFFLDETGFTGQGHAETNPEAVQSAPL